MAATIGVFAGVAGHAACGASQSTAKEAAERQSQWEVKRADWGAGQHRMDVTRRLRQVLYSNANGEVRVDSVTLGFDPAPGQQKTLRISAGNEASEQKSLTYKDGDTLDPRAFDTGAATDRYPGFPPPAEIPGFGTTDAAGEQRQAPRLQIIAAFYGSGNEYNDLTRRLQGMVQDGRLVVDVTDDNMGGDPAIGSNKVLSVVFRVNGGPEQSTTVLQGDTLRIPTEAAPSNENPRQRPMAETGPLATWIHRWSFAGPSGYILRRGWRLGLRDGE
jgi:hypothetical protein